jgi:YVTN family beta-propeller protein
MRVWSVRIRLVFVALAVAACGSACSGSPAPSTASATPTTAPPSPAGASPTSATALVGTWDGTVSDGSADFPVRMVLGACEAAGDRCGSMEYLDPSGSTVFCASDLTLETRGDDRAVFHETMVYQGWNCLETTIAVRRSGDGIAVEQGDGTTVCCRGTLRPVDGAAAGESLPPIGAIGDLGASTAVTALGGTGTQYAAVAGGSLWMPLDNRGAIARIDLATGTLQATIATGDPGRLAGLKTDPHGVASDGDGVWVAMAADRAIGQVSPSMNEIAATIPIDATPYALAIDGFTLWATSFEDDLLVRVDLASGKVVARIPVTKPTGVAVGAGGVWVVLHRDDAVARIDPATNAVAATIAYPGRGPNETCGRCIENVVVADGAVWTADNHGKTVTVIDPLTNAIAATIALPERPWQVTAGGGFVWAGLVGSSADDQPVPRGIVRLSVDGRDIAMGDAPVFGLTWGGDALWGLEPGRRGDLLYRIEPGG